MYSNICYFPSSLVFISIDDFVHQVIIIFHKREQNNIVWKKYFFQDPSFPFLLAVPQQCSHYRCMGLLSFMNFALRLVDTITCLFLITYFIRQAYFPVLGRPYVNLGLLHVLLMLSKLTIFLSMFRFPSSDHLYIHFTIYNPAVCCILRQKVLVNYSVNFLTILLILLDIACVAEFGT